MMAKWFRRRDQDERDLDDEIRFHLAEEARQRVAEGADPEVADVSARRAFGNVLLVREVTRDMWGRRMIGNLKQDVRHGLRLLARHRLFAAFSIASLALGIGGTSAVFSLYHAIVLRELPVLAPDRLVTLSIQGGVRPGNSFMPYPQFTAMRERSQFVEGIFARTTLPNISLGVQGATMMASGLAVTGGYYETLGVRPAIGRLLGEDDDRPGAAPVAVISHAYWQGRFGGEPSIVGRAINLNQAPFTIVGVQAQGFAGVTVGASPDVVIALHSRRLVGGGEPPWSHAFATWIEVMGRLRPGVTIEQAGQELDGIFRQVSADAAATAGTDSGDARMARETHVRVASGATGGVSGLRTGYERGLRLLLLLLAGVLCLASLNVASLLLSRAEARRMEFATRLALGAGRARLVRQLLTESAVIAVAGCLMGLAIAWRGSELLLRLATSNTGALPIDLAPDLRIVAFTCAVSAASCLIFGLLPAIRATSASAVSRGEVGGRRRRILDRTLVVAQTALAMTLVVCAAVFLRSLQNLWGQDTGYDRRNVLMFSIDAGLIGKRGPEALQLYQRVLEDLRAIPTVRSVTISTVRPVSDNYYFIDVVSAVGDQVLPGDRGIRIAFNHLAPGYFDTMGVPFAAGRDFNASDTQDAPKVVIVSERLARHFDGNPVGQRLTVGRGDVREVVGVVRDTRYANVKDAPRDVAYVPFFQGEPRFSPTYEIKFAGTAADTLRAAGGVVAAVNPGLALFRAKTLDQQTEESFARERLLALLTTYFGGFAWLLAGIGLYGLMTCTVTERTREFGLRMALGARPMEVCWSVIRDGAGTVFVGLCLGALAALGVVRLVRTLLFNVDETDPLALAGAVAAVLLLMCAASFVPARRAARVDPMSALRLE